MPGATVVFATKTALSPRSPRAGPGRRARAPNLLGELVKDTAPQLLEIHGVGVDTAATLLVTAGDNPDGCAQAAWAHLCGVAPIPASSGKYPLPPQPRR